MSTQVNKTSAITDDSRVNLKTLAETTGVPLDFIKKELLLDGEETSLDALRQSVLSLLDSTFLLKEN